MTEQEKVIEIIDTLRPFLISDGGNIEFVKYENNIVYIKMLGACAGCELIDMTLKEGVESAIKEEIPSVIKVVNLTNINIDTNEHTKELENATENKNINIGN